MSSSADEDLKDRDARSSHSQTSTAQQFCPAHPDIGSRHRRNDKELNYLGDYPVHFGASIADLGGPVFEEFQGIPMHPLLVHAAVVFVPLLALVAFVYALLPFSRLHLRWVLFALAFMGAGSTFLSKQSGQAFFARLTRNHRIGGDYPQRIANHQHFGTLTFYATLALGAVALLLWWFVRPRARGERAGFDFLSIVLAVATVVAAGLSVYYVIRTGDSGAKMVWTGQ
jgi:hypothetical protein